MDKKYLGIWMDHSVAHFVEYTKHSTPIENEDLTLTHMDKDTAASGSENTINNKEKQKQGEYYKKLADTIKDYDEVLLFGPTNAKAELHNILKDDHHFDNIKISVESADHMSHNQQVAFVKAHFEGN
jgi:ABC-type transport system involved in cytochrome bd biosynthesis fused ATPase/permease subunit